MGESSSEKDLPNLTAPQLERLAVLVDELGEVTHAVGKILLHGYGSHHPDRPNRNNRDDLESELGDLTSIVSFMGASGDISLDIVKEASAEKLRNRFDKYLHHNRLSDEMLKAILGVDEE